MKKLTMLLVGSMGSLMVMDSVAMMIAQKMKIMPKIRWCCQDYRFNSSADIFESIRRVQIGNDYLISWHTDKLHELEQKKLAITKSSWPLDVGDYHYNQDVYNITVDLTENDWEIYKNLKKIMKLRKQNRDLEKRYKEWERA